MTRRRNKADLLCSFPPIAAADARVLVLGTMPSIASLAKQQYYGHPQNAFWPIMGRLFGAGRELPYEERKRILCETAWRCGTCCASVTAREASTRRSDVESESPNDFVAFFRDASGRFAHVLQRPESGNGISPACAADGRGLDREFRYVRLPSTSPAHAGRTFEQKLAAWRAVSRARAEE